MPYRKFVTVCIAAASALVAPLIPLPVGAQTEPPSPAQDGSSIRDGRVSHWIPNTATHAVADTLTLKLEWNEPAAENAKRVATTAIERDAAERQTAAPAANRDPVVPEAVSVRRVANDFANAGRSVLDLKWMQMGAIGAGVILASSALDNRAFKFAKDHQDSGAIKNSTRVGNALPWVAFAGAALVALDDSDPKRSRTGFAAAEAGVSAALLATGIKYAVGRSRPGDGLGPRDFNSFGGSNSNSAFPSRHASVAWAVVTPFALEYDMPWLYGLSALTTLARVGSREHWMSDAVAGSLIGYGMGGLFWESSRANNKYLPRVAVSRNGISLAWKTP